MSHPKFILDRVHSKNSVLGKRWRWSAPVLLAIIALGLVAVRPILVPPAPFEANLRTLPCSDDAAFHLLRLTQLDNLIRQGVLYSRWAPDMALGYGYPLFNFYAPLSYYVAVVISRLGFGLTPALLLTFAAAVLGSGLAAYRLARDHFGKRAALVAAVAYAYAPYQAYDVLFRANLAESAAWPLLPLAMWTMGRLARGGGRRWLAGTALTYAAILLTHNVFALIFSPLLATYGLVMARSPRTKSFPWIGAALALGLGLAVFFWLPALAERDQVHSDRLLVPPVFVYWNNFVRLDEILAGPQSVHPDLINPSPPRALGLIPTALALPGLLMLLAPWAGRTRVLSRLADYRQHSPFVAFFACALVLYIWMMTPAAGFVWDTLPLIEFVQFPWRLLGPAALCLALLVGATIELLPVTRLGGLLAGAAVAILVLGSLFWLDPRYCPGFEYPTAESIPFFERMTDTIGTTAKGEYLPRTVSTVPRESAGRLLDPSAWPADLVIIDEQQHALGAEMLLESPTPFRASANAFFYPGWQATIDDRSVPIVPSSKEGLITFEVPSGRHHISLRFGETVLRLGADLVSAACLVLVLVLLFWPRGSSPLTDDPLPVRRSAARSSNWPWITLGMILFGIVAWILPETTSPLRRPRLSEQGLDSVDVAVNADFENELTLLGYNGAGERRPEQQGPSVPSGEQLRLDLYWTVRAPAARPTQTTIGVYDVAGVAWSPKETAPPRDFRAPPSTPLWQPEMYAQDSHLISILPGTPPGVYALRLTLFDRETLLPMSRLNAAGQPSAPYLDLGAVTVTRPDSLPDPADIEMQHRLNADLGPLELLGANLDRTEARPGDPFALTLFWQAKGGIGDAPDLTAHLALARVKEECKGVQPARSEVEMIGSDADGAATWELPPVSAGWPTSRWRDGDFWRGQHRFRLPAGLEDGLYVWRLRVGATPDQPVVPEAVDLGWLCIDAPDRLWAAPALEQELNVTLSDRVKLLGFELRRPDVELQSANHITVTLAWQGLAEMATSYHVFLHVLSPDDDLVAQSDGEPAHWSRPTTGWAPGEIVLDERALMLSPEATAGAYTVVTGLYDPESGDRLTQTDGSQTIFLFTWQVAEP